MPEKSFNKERWIWGILVAGISTVFGAYVSSNNSYNHSLVQTIAQRDATIVQNDSNCDRKLRNQGSYYEGVIKVKDSTILALKDDKYRSVLDLLNVKKVNGKIKIEQ